MLQKISIWMINVLFFLLSFSFFGQETRSLKQCVEIAIENNPNLHRAGLQHEQDALDKRQAWQNAFPTLEGNIGHNWSQGKNIDPTTNQFIEQTISSGNASVSVGMYLFNGFKVFHDIRQQAAAKKAGGLEYEAQKENLILDVMQAYIMVLTAKDLLEQAESQLNLSKEQIDQAETLNAEGAIDPGDYHDFKGEYNENKNTVANAQQDLHHNRVALAGLLHLSVEDLPTLEPLTTLGAPIYTAAELFETGKQRPFYALWDWRIKEAKQNIKVTQADYYPSLSITAGMDTRYSNSTDLGFWDQNRNNFGKYIALNLNIPIFNGFNARNTVKRAKIELKDVHLQKEIAKNKLREATSNTVFDLKVTQTNLENLQKQEEDYHASFQVAQAKFDLGASNSVLYLTAKNKWENSKNQLVIKQYELILQKYINDYYRGKLMF